MAKPIGEADNVVTMGGREFTIDPPDAIVTLRALRVAGKVGARAQHAAEQLGTALFQAAKAKTEDGKPVESDGISQAVWIFLSVLEEDDLYKLGSALLQFKDEREGVRWLQKNGLQLGPLVTALWLNVQQMDDLMEAVANFTKMLSGIRLANMTSAVLAGGLTQANA